LAKVVLFGGTDVGQGVLRECLLDPEVETVVAVGRATGRSDPPGWKSFGRIFDFDAWRGVSQPDACFFCLGVSSAGMGEGVHAATHDLTVGWASRSPRSIPR
jgi:hypothetical protein